MAFFYHYIGNTTIYNFVKNALLFNISDIYVFKVYIYIVKSYRYDTYVFYSDKLKKNFL